MPDSCDIQKGPDGSVHISGVLAFTSVVKLLDRSRPYFKDADGLRFDLSGVTKTDSAGLALLVEWMAWGKSHQIPVDFVNIPRQMMDIARVSGLDRILPVSMTTG